MIKTQAMVVFAENRPMPGIENPGSHQTYKNPRIEIIERKLKNLSPDEIRVNMLYAGVCGTDVHLVETNPETGYIKSSANCYIPKEGRVIGHEGVGQVISVGSTVKHIRTGDYVTFESIIVCNHCDMCRKGLFNQCRKAGLLGLEIDGLFSTIADVPATLCHNVSWLVEDEQDIKALACIEPAGVAYVACQKASVSGGDSVVIFGAGPIGVYCAMLAKMFFGASCVHIVEPLPVRRELAASWADEVYTLNDFFDNPPKNIDVVIEASGILSNINRIFKYMNGNGRIDLLARSGESLIIDNIDHMITNAISISGTRGHLCGAFDNILKLYKNIPLSAIITHTSENLYQLKELLAFSDKIISENCKVLVKL